MPKPMAIFTVVVVLLLISGASYYYLKSKTGVSFTPAEDGFISRYNALPTAFEKKKRLFESGAIEEVAGSFGLRKGEFFKTNQNGEGWGFIKNGSSVMWNGTEQGTIDLYQYSFISSLASDPTGVSATYHTHETAALLSCYLGFPISVEVRKNKDVGVTNNLQDESVLYMIVHIPNEIVLKADVEDMITVFSVMSHALMVAYNPTYGEFQSILETLPYIQDRVDFEEGKSKTEENIFNRKIRNSKVLSDVYIRWQSYLAGDHASPENPLRKCVAEKMKGIKTPW